MGELYAAGIFAGIMRSAAWIAATDIRSQSTTGNTFVSSRMKKRSDVCWLRQPAFAKSYDELRD